MNGGRITLAVALALVASAPLGAQVTEDVPAVRPMAIVDLRTEEGVRLVQGTWRYHDAQIITVDHRRPGPDLKPSGAPSRTQDITPHAGGTDFDDAGWEAIAPTTLDARRGGGRLSFNWYRINVTIPERVGDVDPTGATVVFEVVVDDYAEIWVDGKLPVVLGQAGGALAKGFNTPNRVVLTRDARPGQRIQLAVFGMNAPVSLPPGNFIWVRSATLDFYAKGSIPRTQRVALDVQKRDGRLDAIVPANPTLEKVAGGFLFTEGPVWVPEGGYLLFSDPNANVIYRWSPDGAVSVYRTKSGYSGFNVGAYHQPGSNGLTLDRDGRLTIDEHGNRRVTRLEKNGVLTVLADRYMGKRFNSPNDLVYRSDGTLFFTDPPFGLPKVFDDPEKELPFSGVFAVIDGEPTLVTDELAGPNGLAFSPDERYLYVGNWDPARKVLMRYAVARDGRVTERRVFADLAAGDGEDALDGIKVDQAGNVYASGPGGLWIFAPDGTHLGTLTGPEHAHNMAWGDEDGRTLYWAAQTGIYRIRLLTPGIRPTPTATASAAAK